MHYKFFGVILVSLTVIHPLLAKTDTITIASYNVENLWDGVADNTDQNWKEFLDIIGKKGSTFLPKSIQYSDYSKKYSNWYSKSVLKQKAKNLLEVLRIAKYPTILGLQEIESSGNKSRVFELPTGYGKTLKDDLNKLGYKYIIIGKQENLNPTSVTTAFISKIPISEEKSVLINRGKFSPSDRDVQIISFQVDHQKILVFNIHLKSKAGGGELERLESVQKINDRLREEKSLNPFTEFILLGDFNASYEEPPMKLIRSTSHEMEMLKPETDLLYNLWFELKEEDRWEYVYNGIRSRLSHILISDTLYNNQGLQYVEQSFQVIGHKKSESHLLDPHGGPFRWQIQKNQNNSSIHIKKGYSDHLPIMASFKVISSQSNPQNGHSKRVLQFPNSDIETNEIKINFPKIKVCNEHESQHLYELDMFNPDQYIGKCIKIYVPNELKPLKLKQWGKYKESYIDYDISSFINSETTRKLKIGLVMLSPFNWRPNIYDSRIDYKRAAITQGKFSSRKPHPQSNQCYHRSVLSKKGGFLRKVVGKLGYTNGHLSIIIANREESQLILEELPAYKKDACTWDKAP